MNFKEGFKRVFLVLAIVVFLIGTAITIGSAWQETNSKAQSELSFQCISVQKHKKIDYKNQNTIEAQIIDKYPVDCEGTKNIYLLTTLLNRPNSNIDELKSYNLFKGDGIVSFYKMGTQLIFPDAQISLVQFLKYINLKLIHKNWYEYIPFFLSKIFGGLFWSLIFGGLFYSLYLLLVWIFSGFTKTK